MITLKANHFPSTNPESFRFPFGLKPVRCHDPRLNNKPSYDQSLRHSTPREF
jgi:hypothetical protein